MSANIYCSRCYSHELSVQVTELAGSESGSNKVISGSISLLSRFDHASPVVVQIQCLHCGYHWNPYELVPSAPVLLDRERPAYQRRWKARFYYAIEHGDYEKAAALMDLAPANLRGQNQRVEMVYTSMKRKDTWAVVISYGLLALFFCFILWLILSAKF